MTDHIEAAASLKGEQQEATARPWRVEGPDMFGDFNILHDADSLAIGAVVSNMRPEAEVAANAALIVKAVNSHDALVRVARTFCALADAKGADVTEHPKRRQRWQELRDDARAALAQAAAQ